MGALMDGIYHDIYLIGSLENPKVPLIGNVLRKEGWDVFDDWFAAGPDADKQWRAYEEQRGHSYIQALDGSAAHHVHEYDRDHLRRSQAAVLVLPAGRSGHLELGVHIGAGRPGYILLADDQAPKWDVMYRWAFESGGAVVAALEDLICSLRQRQF
jgi:hypothetical protein